VFPGSLRGALALDDAAAAGIAAGCRNRRPRPWLRLDTDRDASTTDLRPLSGADAGAIARR
jgi:hypothetical protein